MSRVQLAAYRLLARVGRGGCSTVYRAAHTVDGRVVAVKVLWLKPAPPPAVVARFRRATALLRNLCHAHLVHLLDQGEGEEALYQVLEFLDGGTLARRVRADGPLPTADIVRIGQAVCAVLEYLRARGLVHGDIKPGNIMFSRDGNVTVVDPLLSTDAPATAVYAAPERLAADGAADIRSDLYALGATLFEAACGRRPFAGENLAALLAQKRRGPDRAAARLVCAALRPVLARLMAPAVTDRFATPGAAAAALDRISTEDMLPPCRPRRVPATSEDALCSRPAPPGSRA